ncbi:MAG: hypothetical protein F6K22_14705 [Okeania sp. SIO2F4]|nr:hypothetical protein [Okeania sp. SIO2F4]
MQIHIRNIQIQHNMIERLFNIGTIKIACAVIFLLYSSRHY